SVAQLVAQQARATPGAPAVVSTDGPMSYSQLNDGANQLAYRLREVGVQRGDLVGCCLERSVDMVVTLLGILKSGAAYLPLDPTYTADRLKFILQDARARLLIARE